MNLIQTLEIIQGFIIIFGAIFAAYLYFRTPQEKTELSAVAFNLRINQLAEGQKMLSADVINLRDNHIHTLDIKMDITNKNMQDLALQMVKFNTIIEERIPPKRLVE